MCEPFFFKKRPLEGTYYAINKEKSLFMNKTELQYGRRQVIRCPANILPNF